MTMRDGVYKAAGRESRSQRCSVKFIITTIIIVDIQEKVVSTLPSLQRLSYKI